MTDIVSPQITPKARFSGANTWVSDFGKDYVVIDHLETFDPFFLSLATTENQWFFCSSHGSLSAGRQSPDTALFPYYTVDKIEDNWNTTGPWTAIIVDDQLWNPFRPAIALLTPTHRRMMKSALGDELVFDELHKELGLRLTYRWQLSRKFGFVRKVRLVNESYSPKNLRLVDGLDNFLPPGIDNRMQLQFSCLADAYKLSELSCDGALMIHRLSAGITDHPVPLESLLATSIWAHGLGEGPTFMDRRDAEHFLQSGSPQTSSFTRAHRGAFFLGRELTLAPGEEQEWIMVAEIGQSQTTLGELQNRLSSPEQLIKEVEADLLEGSSHLREIVASADGLQQTADRDTTLYHYNNTLCNILRGGIPADGYQIKASAFRAYLKHHNTPLLERNSLWLATLPSTISRQTLISLTAETEDTDLIRLTTEYLPLILSRRHGDPSRPWNHFDIRLRDDSGNPIYHFEGNWRDIFQNWEALSWSYPEFLDSFITKFLNASTIDGFNPYRLTSEGLNWETPDADDPWASIGYWGDHQIVYLLKLLELSTQIYPDQLVDQLDDNSYVFADVPYRLAGWEETLEDPRNTVTFDEERHAELMAFKEKMGSDGLLLRKTTGELLEVTLLEKLLLPAAVKLANLIPGGGIWMNTQRPEWNDANNALAGCGISVVTAAYLARYLDFLENLLATGSPESFHISSALYELLESLSLLLEDELWHQDQEIAGRERFEIARTAGHAISRYRSKVYNRDFRPPNDVSKSSLQGFLANARRALESTLRQNRRPDGLWHSYNILQIDPSTKSMSLKTLPVMLEGQVAILSAGILNPEESLTLLESLPNSELRTERHKSYLLYPDKPPLPFLKSNRVSRSTIESVDTLVSMIQNEDSRIIVPDPHCDFRFHPALTNAYALTEALDQLQDYSTLEADRSQIESLYESTFQHHAFTGRSGTMFGYEGLGCVYWHMVSKLMLAVMEVTHDAKRAGAPQQIIDRLTESYFSVQKGLGYRKSPEEYGAFPAEPYSHSPAHAGAKQPGLTGQVKEGILCRFGELGISFDKGLLTFRPLLLQDAEFTHPQESRASETVSFTLAGTAIHYRCSEHLDQVQATVHFSDGAKREFSDGIIDQRTTFELTHRTGNILQIDVTIPAEMLVT